MSMSLWISGIFKRLGSSRTAPTLVCGDCERCDSCGLAPHDDCIVKAAQLARADGRPRSKHDQFVSDWMKMTP